MLSRIAATPATPKTTPIAPTAPAPTAVDPYDPAVIAARLEAGRRAETTAGTLPPGLGNRPAPSYFRTYEQLKSSMFELQAKYPDLVEVRDIGDTWEKTKGIADRDVLALVLTNKKGPADKPSTLHVGGIHAREIANPELLMTFAGALLDGYGRDADATMLLDSRETVLVPMLNADGHAVVEKAFAGTKGGDLMQRKNTNSAGNVDLNRNFEWHWGGPGASPSPRSETYRGPSAASEPETQAIQQFVDAEHPDFFIDWHSYSKLNMYPWGDTKEPTKDHVGFKALAEKFTTYNGYSPIQSIKLYPTTGTTDDHVYGTHGSTSMAIETGSSFHQSDAEFQKTLAENLPILEYTAKVADAPFERVLGPDAKLVQVDSTNHRVSARVTDANNGGNVLAGAEIVFDPNAAPGSGIALEAADGSFDSVDELVLGSTAEAAAGADMVFVRGRDAEGHWGPLSAQWLAGARRP